MHRRSQTVIIHQYDTPEPLAMGLKLLQIARSHTECDQPVRKAVRLLERNA